MTFQEVDIDAPKEPLPTWVRISGVVLGAAIVIVVAYFATSYEGPNLAKIKGLEMEEQLDPSGADDHQTLRFIEDLPPKISPAMEAVREEDLKSVKVIGIASGDVAHAYMIQQEPLGPLMLICTKIGDTPIVITHNYLVDKTRVLYKEDANEVFEVRLGGWEYQRAMVLMYDDVRYVQDSKRIPLKDMPFEVTDLASWVEKHPDTLVNYDEADPDTSLYERWPDMQSLKDEPQEHAD